MSPPPPGYSWGTCDACGKPCARPRGARWYACWRASCHPATEVRLRGPS